MTPFAAEVGRCRDAQAAWARVPVRDRVRPLRAFRHRLVEAADELLAAVEAELGRSPGDVTATDLLPTAAAAKWLGRRAGQILAPRRATGRPLWLLGCRDTVHRRPHGVVGVVGTWNYPVFLTAVPILHAVAAGNGVLFKPSERCPRTAAVLADVFAAAGFPPGLIQTLPADRDAGPRLAEADIDFLHFTGSEPVGRKLATRLGERLIPSALELSGCDAAVVLADADVEFAARCVWYAATFNRGQTCMAARRALVARSAFDRFAAAVRHLAKARPGELSFDRPAAWAATFEPRLVVLPFDELADAVRMVGESPFRLTASVFAADRRAAEAFAAALPVGVVTVNDAIAPTAHPDTPFGGRQASGWGVTQGAEGLLAMTVPQTVSVRRGRFRPHVDAYLGNDPAAADVTGGLFRLTHAATWRERVAGLAQMLGGMRRTTSGSSGGGT